jgi:hypothetical protein
MKPHRKIYWYQFKFNIGDVVYIYIYIFIRRLGTQHCTKSKIMYVDLDANYINQVTNPLRGYLAIGKYCQYVDVIVIT